VKFNAEFFSNHFSTLLGLGVTGEFMSFWSRYTGLWRF